MFEKFESISELRPCGKKMVNGEPDRQLKNGAPMQMHLDPTEFDLLYAYIARVPW